MHPRAPTEAEILAIHAALIEACARELTVACDGRDPSFVALIALPHGTPEAQVAFASRADVARELLAIAADEGPAAIGLDLAAAELMRPPPARAGHLLCAVVALGRARLHEIPWPDTKPPSAQA